MDRRKTPAGAGFLVPHGGGGSEVPKEAEAGRKASKPRKQNRSQPYVMPSFPILPWDPLRPALWNSPTPVLWNPRAPKLWGHPIQTPWGPLMPTPWGPPMPAPWGTPMPAHSGPPAPSAPPLPPAPAVPPVFEEPSSSYPIDMSVATLAKAAAAAAVGSRPGTQHRTASECDVRRPIPLRARMIAAPQQYLGVDGCLPSSLRPPEASQGDSAFAPPQHSKSLSQYAAAMGADGPLSVGRSRPVSGGAGGSFDRSPFGEVRNGSPNSGSGGQLRINQVDFRGRDGRASSDVRCREAGRRPVLMAEVSGGVHAGETPTDFERAAREWVPGNDEGSPGRWQEHASAVHSSDMPRQRLDGESLMRAQLLEEDYLKMLRFFPDFAHALAAAHCHEYVFVTNQKMP